MSEYGKRPEWMNDDLVKDISPQKLSFLENVFGESKGKNQKEMMALLMPMMKKAKQENLTFTAAEMNAAIAAIKKHSTTEEVAKMDKILSDVQSGKPMGTFKNGGN